MSRAPVPRLRADASCPCCGREADMVEIPEPVVALLAGLPPETPVARARCRRGSCQAWYWIRAGAFAAAYRNAAA